MKLLRIGTRGSMLALWQANHIAERLQQLHGVQTELVLIRTSGDRFQSASVAQIGLETGAKGIFIKELEDALLAGTVDLAVHSMKDVPTETPDGLAFAAITHREDPRDALISRNGEKFQNLPPGACIGTSSLRRQAQLRHHRPDLEIADLRGNVDTRLKKLAGGEFDAIVLAVAGVNRLGQADKITEIFGPEIMLPAVGQGALGIETRVDDRETAAFVAALDDADTRACVNAERALLHELHGGCQVPLGAWARLVHGNDFRDTLQSNQGTSSIVPAVNSVHGKSPIAAAGDSSHGPISSGALAPEDSQNSAPNLPNILIDAAVFSSDGREFVRRSERCAPVDAAGAGKRLGRILMDAGADRLLRLAGRSVGQL